MNQSLLQKILKGQATEAEKEEALRQQSNEVISSKSEDERILQSQNNAAIYPKSQKDMDYEIAKSMNRLPSKHNEYINAEDQALEEGLSPLDFPLESAALVKGAAKATFPMLRSVVKDIPELVGNEMGVVSRDIKAARNAKKLGISDSEYKNLQSDLQNLKNKDGNYFPDRFDYRYKLKPVSHDSINEGKVEGILKNIEIFDAPSESETLEEMRESLTRYLPENIKNDKKYLDYYLRKQKEIRNKQLKEAGLEHLIEE
jgi:hypothetical protein